MEPGEFREVGHRVVDLLAEYLEHIEEKPVFPNVEPSIAKSSRHYCGFHLLSSQPKHRGLYDWSRRRGHGETNRALAYRPGRLQR